MANEVDHGMLSHKIYEWQAWEGNGEQQARKPTKYKDGLRKQKPEAAREPIGAHDISRRGHEMQEHKTKAHEQGSNKNTTT